MIGLAAAMLLVGIVVGWFLRGSRVAREKAAISAGWQDQINVQQAEHDRIADQNKSLMEQISQYRGSKKDADRQVNELSESLRATQTERDALEKELREARSNLEISIKQRDRLKQDSIRQEARETAAREKDEKIFKLSRELETWQNRLPPLLERFRERNLEAEQLAVELDKANARVAELETRRPAPTETQIEPVQDASLATDLAASNEQYDETGEASVLTESMRGGHAGDDGQRIETDAVDDVENIGSATEEADVDFDLGTETFDTAAESVTERSIAEVFSDDSAILRVDELLSGGDTPVGEAETFSNDEDDIALQPAPTNGDVADGSEADDLQRIKGVGPAIEKTLNRLGIYRFYQIAGMSEVDIDRVANELRGFRSRIYREDWIGQARMLQREAAGDAS
ncbi:MAG: hypothetical protein AAGA61_01845 [Pseudomonadota bacterium]